MLPDPYSPGQVPRVLAGRRVELGRIRDRLGRVATYGELAGPVLVFHAPRGIGKTSLLRAAEREAAALGFATAWLACSRDRPFLPELLRSVERALERVDLKVDSRRRWRERLQRVSVQLGVLGVSMGGEVALAPRDPAEGPIPGAAPIGAVEDLLHEASSLVRERGGAGLAVFVDELHAASADDLATLLNAVQNLDGAREDNPLTVVVAGLPITPEAITKAATFGERSTFVALDVLSDDDARSLLRDPAEGLEVSWSDEALDHVVARVGGHPYVLQLIGSSAWEVRRPDKGDEIDAAVVAAATSLAEQRLDGMHVARWSSATPLEQTFITAMAAAGSGNVTRAQIARGMGVASQAISVPRERLIEKGVIEPVGHGLVRFTMPGFDAWVRARSDDGA